MAILRGAMADVEELLQAFVAEHERGGEADVQAYLARAASEDARAQLASLEGSASWRLTAPLRRAKARLRIRDEG